MNGRDRDLVKERAYFVIRAFRFRRLLSLEFLINFHVGTIGAIFRTRLPGYRSFLINHLPGDSNDIVFNQLLAHILNIYVSLVC